MLAVREEDKKVALESYNENLLNTEFDWDRNSLVDPVSSAAILIDRNTVRKAVRKMKNGKAAGPSGIVSEMVKAAEEDSVDMITDLINQIIREGVVPAD